MNQTNYKLLTKVLENDFEECSKFFNKAKFFAEKDKFLFYPQLVLALYYYSVELKRGLKEDDKTTHRLFVYEIERVNKRSGEYHNQLNNLLDNRDLLNDLLIHSSNTIISNIQKLDKDTLKITLRGFIFKALILKDRKSPDYINKLLVQLINPQKGDTIFEPAVGIGNTLRTALEHNPKIKLLGLDKDAGIIDFANLNLFLSGYNNPDLKYSDFIDNALPINPPVDIIISQPTPNESFFNFPHLINDFSAGTAEEDVLSKLLLSIKPYTGRMAIVVPNIYLSKPETLDFRRKIIDKDNLEAFIKLPEYALGTDQTSVSIIVINNNKKTKKKNKVLFIDANSGITSEIRNGLVSFEGISLNDFTKEVLHIFTINKVKSNKIGLIIKTKKELIDEKYQLIEYVKTPPERTPREPEQPEPPKPLEQTSGELQTSFPINEFISSMQIVSTKEDLKSEFERFAKYYLPEAENIFYQEISQSDNPQRINDDSSREKSNQKYIQLTSFDHKVVHGVLKFQLNNSISETQKKVLNDYLNLLIKMSRQPLQISEAKADMAGFSHTAKNFFASMQSELDLLIETSDTEIESFLKNRFADKEEIINLMIESGQSTKEDFKIWNVLANLKAQISSIARYYKAIEFSIQSGGNTSNKIELIELINSLPIPTLAGVAKVVNSYEESVYIFGNRDRIKQAITDIVQNSISYSENNSFQIDIKRQGIWVELLISNPVSDIMPEQIYNRLGKERIENNNDFSSGIGLLSSFNLLKENNCEVSLSEYRVYKEESSFIVRILLPSKK